MIFHYQGSWGSEGYYTFHGLGSDIAAALDYLLNDNQPFVDPKRVAILGYSMGGGLAIGFASHEKRIMAVAAVSTYSDEKAWEKKENIDLIRESGESVLRLRDGGKGPGSLVEESKVFFKNHRPIDAVAKISPRPLLLVHGTVDESFDIGNSQALFR